MKLSKSSKKTKRIRKRKITKVKYLTRKYIPRIVFAIKALVVVFTVGGISYLILFSPFFSIKYINVSGTREFVNPTDIKLIAESNAKGKNILKFDKKSLVEKLESNLLGAKIYHIKKSFPSTLNITVQERTPIAIIYRNADEYFFVDEDGYVLGYTDPGNQELPKIKYDKDIKIGLFIDKNLVPIYLELTKLFVEEEVRVSSMSFSPKHVHLYLEDGPEVLIGNDKNKSEALKTVAALIKESEVEDKEVRRIDIRYDKVIVLFK